MLGERSACSHNRSDHKKPSIHQSINQILKAPHEHKRSHIPAQPHGQQTPRREAPQAWGAKSESRQH